MEALLAFLGIIFVIWGIWARFGRLKGVYLFKGIPSILPSGYIYAVFPIALWLISIYVASFQTQTLWTQRIVGGGAFVCLIISVLFMIWQPRWLKPAWLRWLEDNYGHVLEEMFEEARQMGTREWEAQVRTQADLEEWADNVAHKHGWQRLS